MINDQSSDDEIVRFLAFVKDDAPCNAQLAAELALVFASSGKRYKPPTDLTADVASTGGPSSLSTLLCPLFLRAGGLVVPKLGVPGRPAGGIDCLAQIGGYQTELDESALDRILSDAGYAHFLAAGKYSPLDAHVFSLRQKHGFQEVPTLVAASLLSKKLSVGVKNAGLDVRVARHGNFGRTMDEAAVNAKLFSEAATLLEINPHPVLTDGSVPYQPYIGRSEALIALCDIFDGAEDTWLDEHFEQCRSLSSAASPAKTRQAVESASRAELKHWFLENVRAQGASEGDLFTKVETARNRHRLHIVSEQDGRVQVSLDAVRVALVALQGASGDKYPFFADPGGIILKQRVGATVKRGDVLASVRADEISNEDDFLAELKKAIFTLSFDSTDREKTL